jgi:hypothetical protein
MSIIILSAALVLTGIVAGLYVSTTIHDRRIAELSASEYAAMHQMRDKTFGVVMPPFRLVTLALTVVAAFVTTAGLPRWLAIVAAVLIVADIVLTVKLQVPLNEQVQSWSASTIPTNWAEVRDRWAARHSMRLLIGLASYICIVAAAVLTLSA